MLAIPLALLAAIPSPQANDLVHKLILQGDPVPGLPDGYEITSFDIPVRGHGGGWLAWASGDSDLQPGFVPVLIGQRPDAIDAPVQLLRKLERIDGIEQTMLNSPSMANGVVAYMSRSNTNGTTYTHAWIEDELIAHTGRPIEGQPQWTWTVLHQVRLTTSGRALLLGVALDPSDVVREVLVSWPDGEVLLASGSTIPGLANPVGNLYSGVTESPDGSHWAMIVREGSAGSFALVVNGAVHELAPGYPAVTGSEVPDALAGSFDPAILSWISAGYHFVNDRGDVAFLCLIHDPSGQSMYTWVRNGRVFLEPIGSGYVFGMDERGALAHLRFVSHELIEFEGSTSLLRDFEVDIDGDGVADPGAVHSATFEGAVAPNAQHLCVLRLSYELTPGEFRFGLFRARDFRMGTPICEGEDNSTGVPAQLVAVGSRELDDNDVRLRMFGLPVGSTGYLLTSRSPGLVPLAGGSQGNLCLSGGIGRLTGQAFSTGLTGRAAIVFDLDSIPQPLGDVAAMAGERWFVQAWYRDSVAGQATSNFTSASGFEIE